MTEENPSVTKFREYLRIKSVQPNPDYDASINWIKKQAEEIGLEYNIIRFQPPPGFTVYLTWKGSDPTLKSIMLNSHIDVVPVDSDMWTHDPFSAVKDKNGKIFGRGTQDMKSVGVQHLEAIKKLKAKGFVPRRTVHVTFVPDEEIGGANGMAKFVETEEFRQLNIGFELDEGGPCPTENFIFCYAERAWWQLKFSIPGNTGHALNFVENTSVEKLEKLLNGFLEIRAKEKAKLSADKGLSDLGLVTTLNITMINGGLQPNVIPSEMTLVLDIRISPNGWTELKVEEMIKNVVKNAGEGITYEFIGKNPIIPEIALDDSNPFYICFRDACEQMNMKMIPIICPGATDARYVRKKGILALGFSPMNHTPMLLHNHDEFIDEHVFLKGIDIFVKIIADLASLE